MLRVSAAALDSRLNPVMLLRDDAGERLARGSDAGLIDYTAAADGEHCLSWPSNISSTPVEVAERLGPVFCHHKRLRPGSGGDGRRRGGLGQDILFEITSPRPVAGLFMTERTKFAAPGMAGGVAGGVGRVEINGTPIDTHVRHMLNAGDKVLLRLPGGGGFGAANERHADLTAEDARLGLLAEG